MKIKISQVLNLPTPPNENAQRYGKAFEYAVYNLLKTKDAARAFNVFIWHYGEPHNGAFAKIMKLAPWAKEVADVEPAPPVKLQIDGVTVSVQADFVVKYADGRREVVELKSHVLKKDEWRLKAEYLLQAKIISYAYGMPALLVYFQEEEGGRVVAKREKIRASAVTLEVLRRRIYTVM